MFWAMLAICTIPGKKSNENMRNRPEQLLTIVFSPPPPKKGFIGTTAALGGSENKERDPLLAGFLNGDKFVPYMRYLGGCLGVGSKGWLSCFAHPLGGVLCVGSTLYLAFALEPLVLLQSL